jgi:hypothetical protein
MTTKIHTLDECRELGATHAAYGWSRRPWGHWNDEQKAAYTDGWLKNGGK